MQVQKFALNGTATRPESHLSLAEEEFKRNRAGCQVALDLHHPNPKHLLFQPVATRTPPGSPACRNRAYQVPALVRRPRHVRAEVRPFFPEVCS